MLKSLDIWATICYYIIVPRELQERSFEMENAMTNHQFTGIIRMIIALIKSGTSTEELISYLEELIKE